MAAEKFETQDETVITGDTAQEAMAEAHAAMANFQGMIEAARGNRPWPMWRAFPHAGDHEHELGGEG